MGKELSIIELINQFDKPKKELMIDWFRNLSEDLGGDKLSNESLIRGRWFDKYQFGVDGKVDKGSCPLRHLVPIASCVEDVCQEVLKIKDHNDTCICPEVSAFINWWDDEGCKKAYDDIRNILKTHD